MIIRSGFIQLLFSGFLNQSFFVEGKTYDVDGKFWFDGISTIVNYLMPNPVLFLKIQFYINQQS